MKNQIMFRLRLHQPFPAVHKLGREDLVQSTRSLFLNLLFLLFLFVSCADDKNGTGQVTLSGKVVRIADGDTFTVLTEEKKQVKVRLYGIDCPERGQDFGQVARQKLSDLIFSKTVFIEEIDKDRYGRTVAIVYDEQRHSINEVMLHSGLAWHYKVYDDDKAWSRLEGEAKRKRIGLWSQPHATPPWE